MFSQSVTVVRAGARTTRAGDVVADWSPDAVTRVLVERVSVQPNFQQETGPDGLVVEVRATGYRVLSEPGRTPDVRGTDRVEYRGVVHAVVGEVAFWPDPHGQDHIEFGIAEWRGA